MPSVTRRAFAALALSVLAAMAAMAAPAAANSETTGAAPTSGIQVVTVDPGPGQDVASGLAVQADGKTVVVGASTPRWQGGGSDMSVLRFTAAGILDPTFGDKGRVLLDNGDEEAARAVVIQPDGMIVVVGTAAIFGGASGSQVLDQMAVVRLDQAGRSDPTFNGGKMMVLRDRRATSTARAVALQPDGKILLAGSGYFSGDQRGQQFLLMRLTPSGTIDATFGDAGLVQTDAGDLFSHDEATFVARRPDGKIIVGGTTGGLLLNGHVVSDTLLAQYSPLGLPDASFGTGGFAFYNNGVTMSGAALRADGSLVAAGYAALDPFSGAAAANVAVAAYRADGSLDRRFGAGGITVAHSPPAVEASGAVYSGFGGKAAAIALDGRGRLVVAGATGSADGSDMALLRFNGAGALDGKFGRAGWHRADNAKAQDALSAAGVLPDGRIVAAGRSVSNMAADMIVFAIYSSSDRPSATVGTGWNPVGQLGDGTAVDRSTLTPVTGLVGGATISGGVLHSLALDDSGTVYCWGWNGVGALGDGTTLDHRQPMPVPGLSDVAAATAGFYHSLAVVGGRVEAWGWNPTGQLGDGTTVDRHAPVPVAVLDNVVAVAAGAYHSLALRSDGTVWAWGWNGLGQLGDGTTVERHQPVVVAGLRNVVALAAGTFHSAALTSDGSVWTWGWNGVGQLGDGSITDRHGPVRAGADGMVAITAGGLHSLALKADGSVWGWGYNAYGEVGDGSLVDRPVPVRIRGLAEVDAIAAGYLHSAAITSDRHVWTWGWNGVGPLGDGTTVDRHTPVPTAGQVPAAAIAAGAFHTLVLG